MTKKTTTRVHLMVSKTEVRRADDLVEWAAAVPEIAPTGTATRSHVMREALRIGLDSLQRRKDRDERDGDT